MQVTGKITEENGNLFLNVEGTLYPVSGDVKAGEKWSGTLSITLDEKLADAPASETEVELGHSGLPKMPERPKLVGGEENIERKSEGMQLPRRKNPKPSNRT